MNPLVDFLKSRDWVSVPAKYRPGTLTDSHSAVCAGNRSLMVSSGRQSSAKIEASNRKPVQAITRSYASCTDLVPRGRSENVTR